MKPTLFHAFFFIAVFFALTSCTDRLSSSIEDIVPDTGVQSGEDSTTGYDIFGLFDPGSMDQLILNLSTRNTGYSYYINDPEDIAFSINVPCKSYLTFNATEDQWNYRSSRLSKTIEIVKDLPGFPYFLLAPCFYDAGIDSGIRIFADKPLCSREAGEDISDLMIITEISSKSVVRSSFPDFEYIGLTEVGMPLREYFSVGSALHKEFVEFSFKSIPEDLPSDFTLTIEIPVKKNIGWEDLSFVFGRRQASPAESVVLSASLKVHFD